MITERPAPSAVPAAVRPSAAFVPADASGVARIVIDRPDDAVNAIDPKMIEDLAAAIAQARAARPRGLVVESAKADQFVGGADLDLVSTAGGADLERASRAVQQVFDDLASLPCTVVAAINGSALGGGFELALACDRRIAADAPSVRIGLPEVTIGLVPAAGGTQRLPRLVGLPRALDLLLAGRRLGAKRALRAGLVDEVVHPAALSRAAAEDALRSRKAAPRGGPTPVERAVTFLAPARAFALSQARDRVMKETRGHYPAPLRCLEVVATGLAQGMAAGLAAEARAFSELAPTPTTRNLVRLLRLTLHQRKGAFDGLGRAAKVERVGVVGLGFMGSGIAQAASAAGAIVRGRDRDAAAVAKGLGTVRSLTTDAAKKGVFDRREAARIVARVTGGSDLAGFAHADVVIEAVFEDLVAKRNVVRELEAVIRDDAVIASNTSALPIADIAAGARRPDRIVGMHFFSPVHKMPLIEVVRPRDADPRAVATVVGLAVAMGKTVIVVGDGPGFYTTRVISTMISDAFALVTEGIAVDSIDRAMVEFGWPVGPLKLADEVGLEVGMHAAETVAKARGLEVPPLIRSLVSEGFKGKGRGGGFYLYEGGQQRVNPRVYELAGTTVRTKENGIAGRLTTTFAREARRCLDEGILRSEEEGDLGAIMGLGFPPYLGGPFVYAKERGIA